MKINKNMQTIVFLYRGHLEEGTKIQKEKASSLPMKKPSINTLQAEGHPQTAYTRMPKRRGI